VHRLACVLLAVVGLIVGCGAHSATPAAKPEPVTLTVAPRPGVDYVAVVGDSFTAGSSEGGTGRAGWPYLVYSQLLNQHIYMDAKVDAMGTSGWVKSSRKDARTFAEHLNVAAGTNDRLVVLFGARGGDVGVPVKELDDAVNSTLSKAKEKAPKAAIVVIGPAWIDWQYGGPSPDLLSVRDTVKARAEASGAVFVDPIAEEWFAGRPELVASDGINPTDDGHAYMADKIAPVIGQLLAQSAAP
jgi:lysophospholipase L1-like esterase